MITSHQFKQVVRCGVMESANVNKVSTTKLKVTDYVFEYKGNDLTNAYLEYYRDKVKYTEYKNGKKDEEYYIPIIFLAIKAKLDNSEYSFDFAIEKYVDILNNLEVNNTRDITEFINYGETNFQGPDEFELFLNKDSIYSYEPVFKVTKLDINKFLFKIQYRNLFIWFIVNFD